MSDINARVGELLARVRKRNGVVHQITNNVTVNDCANVTLAIGASPIMADENEEAAEIVTLASALVLNMGTLNTGSIKAMLSAGKAANTLGVPVIIDPVAAGASRLRNETMKILLDHVKPQVIRGNMSEIAFLVGAGNHSKGVDVSEKDTKLMREEGARIAKDCAQRYGCTIAITGKTDIVSNGQQTFYIENGHSMLSKVTGTGCMCSALIGCFHSAASISFEESLLAAIGGVAAMGVCGELAYAEAGTAGTASFRVALIDNVSKIDPMDLQKKAKIYAATN